jgi:hypothetical protein
MRKCLYAVAVLVLTACSTPSEVTKDVTADSTSTADAPGEVKLAEMVEADSDPDLFQPQDVPATDLPPETLEPVCEAGEGCFLDPCAENSDCLSSWCVQHMGEPVCTSTCQDECPPGWTCQLVAGSVPDAIFICISDFTHLCRPCATASDCQSAVGTEDVCVQYGDDGSFCGGGCGADDDCPWGFSCLTTDTVDGISTLQCVADAGVCPCTSTATELALWTPCEVENEWGLCEGKRICGEGGLSDCDATVPAEETCNGTDDDCDGESDEGTCDDDNLCTEDICLGADGCQHLPLDEGECIDGNPCTVADHCIAGECVGSEVLCDDDNTCTDDSCDETGGCFFVANSDDCDDGDPCTVADQCKDEGCAGYQVDCACQENADCGALEDGDLCNGTLVCDTAKLPYQCVVDPATVVDCPPPDGDSFCQAASCDPATAGCSIVPAHQGFACSDADACTMGEACDEGNCTGSAPVNCNDGNPCTDDTCDSIAGCQHVANVLACSDEDTCTVGDICVASLCVSGEAADCDDGNLCTDDSCDSALGCQHTANDLECDDGDGCTLGDFCADGQCQKGPSSVQCDDSNPCTDEACDGLGGCTFQNNVNPCEDGNLCTFGDSCEMGECKAGNVTLPCDDSNPCTDDTCDPTQGCVYSLNEAPCEDGNVCTINTTCSGGQCSGELKSCDDNSKCTNDSCDPAIGCLHVQSWDDNSLCLVGICDPEQGLIGWESPCDDGNLCTKEVCDENTGGCIYEDIDCSDGNLCTTDNCKPDIGCTNIPSQAPCDDGDLCTLKDQCSEGECVGTTPLNCDDSNPCTDDSCDGETGCVHMVHDGECDDSNACTDGDTCKNGLCIPGPKTDCDDDNECTADGCDVDDGCEYFDLPDGTSCNGGGKWGCSDGACACTPQCEGKLCGDDQCGGSCGTCDEDYNCNENTGKCYPGGGIIYRDYTWYLGPRGKSCLGVCEGAGLSCANLVAVNYQESCGDNVCLQFFQGLGCGGDGDGPRLSSTNAQGLPSGSSKCIYRSNNWGGWSCAWVQRTDDVRFCPCE